MSATDTLSIRAGDTETLDITIGATLIDGTPLNDLAALDVATFYARKRGEETNEIDGAALTVVDSAIRLVRLDPIGAGPDGANAFAEPGVYLGYVLALWLDGDTTRHPGDHDLVIMVRPRYDEG